MARTLLQMRQAVYNCLAEPLNSPMGELRAGDGVTTSPVLTDAFINQALNRRLAEIARTCVPLVGTVTGVAYPANSTILTANGLATQDGGVLWAVRNVYLSGVALRETDRSWARFYGLTATTPDSWYPEAEGGFGLDPAPTVQTTVTVEGLEIPPALASDSATPTWLRADLDELPVWGAAADLAERNASSPKFAPLVALWQGKYDAARLKQWERIAVQDPEMARRFFPGPPATGGK